MFFRRGRKNEEEHDTDEIDQIIDHEIQNIEEVVKKKSDNCHVCPMPDCESEFVYSVERYQINDTEWKVRLLCPNCWNQRTVIVGRETVRTILKRARAGRERIMKDLDHMQKKHMEEEVEKFITALQKDYILPDDFTPPTNKDVNEGWIRDLERARGLHSSK